MRCAVMFGTAFFLELLLIVFERHSPRSDLALLPAFIKGVACTSYVLASQGVSVIIYAANGRPHIAQRYVQWMHTTPTMLMLLAMGAGLPRKQVRLLPLGDLSAGYDRGLSPGLSLGNCAGAFSGDFRRGAFP